MLIKNSLNDYYFFVVKFFLKKNLNYFYKTAIISENEMEKVGSFYVDLYLLIMKYEIHKIYLQIQAHGNIANFHVIQRITCLEDLRLAMIKASCANLCSRSYNGFCKSGLFIRKGHSTSDKCKDCEIKIRKEKRNE